MARKTSDIAMLLGSSRSKSRSRSGGGITALLMGFVDKLLGRSSKRSRRPERRHRKVSMWLFVAGLLLAFGGGFMIGDRVSEVADGSDPLRAPGRTPSFVNEVDTKPLSPEAFVVAAYPGEPDEEAKTSAVELANYLQQQGFAKARPYPWEQDNGPLWLVAVYFDGDQEAQKTSDMLKQLPPDVPDARFVKLRKQKEWPSRHKIQ